MKFEQVYELQTEKRITVAEAASMLGMSERHMRRYIQRYREEGLDGLNDKRLATAAHNAAPVDEVLALTDLYESRYSGYSAAHFYDKYRQHHHGQRSYNWVRLTLQRQGMLQACRKKGQHRRKRPRQPMVGMMIHQDASTHQWIEGVYWDLVVTMDDASNEIYSAFFVEQEGTWSSFQGVKEVIESRGLFCSFYSDRGSHYWTTDSAGEKVNKHSLTQFGRAMQQLGIEMIAAYSPEARGRSERMFRTLQGRLPLELKSAGIRTLADANRFLKHTFLPEFNERFRVEPSISDSAFVPWPQGGPIKLDDILCLQSQRTVNNDNTVSYRGQVWQIPGDRQRCSYRKAKVRVNEYLDGGVAIFHGPRKLVEFGAGPVGSASGSALEGLVDLWTSPTDRSAPDGPCGKGRGQHAVLPTALPHSLPSRPQGPQA